MSIGPDGTYAGAAKIYTKQQPEGVTLNGNTITTEEVTDVGGLQNNYGLYALNGVIQVQKLSITAVPGAATVTTVTIQLQDNGGQNVANQPYDFDLILSDSAFGVGLTATVTQAVAFTSGIILNTYTANKAYYVQCDATGKVVFTLTDAARTQFYIMIQTPNAGPTVVRILTANYG